MKSIRTYALWLCMGMLASTVSNGVCDAAPVAIEGIVTQASGLLQAIYPIVIGAVTFGIGIAIVKRLHEGAEPIDRLGGNDWLPDPDEMEAHRDEMIAGEGPEIEAPDSDFHDDGVYPDLYAIEAAEGNLGQAESPIWDILPPETSDEKIMSEMRSGLSYEEAREKVEGDDEVRVNLPKTVDI